MYANNHKVPMRAVIVYNSCWYVFLLRRNLIKALQRSGCTVTVVAPEDGYTQRVQQLGVDFLPLTLDPCGTHPLRDTASVVRLFSILGSLRPEVVLSFTIKCNLYTGLCRRILPFHHIANVSGLGEGFDRPTAVSKVIRTLYRGALRRSERIFFQNAEDLRLCVTHGLVPPKNSRLIPGSGVDLSQFPPNPFPLGRSGTPRIALIFGRLLPKKGFYDFLNAAAVLKHRWGDQARFVVMGAADPDRPESMKLLSAIKAAAAAGTITYLDPRDDVLPVLQQADVVVLPSTYNEGVPRSLLEALACAKPVITTDWRGCRDVVRDGKNGYLIQPNNLEALLQALHSILAAPPEQLHAMGRASRALAEQCYDEQVVINAYLAALPGAAPSSGSPSVSAPQLVRS